MAEEEKGVTVVTSRSPHVKAKHQGGTGIRVENGHLFVAGGGGPTDVIAIYAPDKWVNASVDR